jgi:predicted nucleotidyltransferase
MTVPPIALLLEHNMPFQIQILEQLLIEFSQAKGIKRIFVRGSIARGYGALDRSSDTDLVLEVEQVHFLDYLRSMDDLMVNRFGALMPGWVDRIVPNFGGTGLVYLVRSPENLVYQVDIYVTPESTADFSSIQPGEIRQLFPLTDDPCGCGGAPRQIDAQIKQQVCSEIEQFSREKDGAVSDFVSTSVLAFMVLKRIQRAQFFLNRDNTGDLLCSIRQLLRRRYAPHLVEFGWYKLDAITDVCADAANYVYELKQVTIASSINQGESTYASVASAFSLALKILEDCFPDEFADLRLSAQFLLEIFTKYARQLN